MITNICITCKKPKLPRSLRQYISGGIDDVSGGSVGECKNRNKRRRVSPPTDEMDEMRNAFQMVSTRAMFVHISHGFYGEKDDNVEYTTIPNGFTFVMLGAPGEIMSYDQLVAMWPFFSDRGILEKLSRGEKNNNIFKDARVYNEGDDIRDITFEVREGERELYSIPFGLYELPINKDWGIMDLVAQDKTFGHTYKKKLSDFIKIVQPGIYFLFNCRGPNSSMIDKTDIIIDDVTGDFRNRFYIS